MQKIQTIPERPTKMPHKDGNVSGEVKISWNKPMNASVSQIAQDKLIIGTILIKRK